MRTQLPYRSRISTAAVPWTDSASFRANNCVAVDGTNGVDLNAPSNAQKRAVPSLRPVDKFRQVPATAAAGVRFARRRAQNTMLDSTPPTNIVLPAGLAPAPNVPGSTGVSQFFLLDDGKTGVLALGSFIEADQDVFMTTLLTGLTNLKNAGATQLIVDVVRKLLYRFVLLSEVV